MRASLTGGAAGAIVFVWMLTNGTFDLFHWQRVGDFYDLQAHSILGGHLTVDRVRLGVEAFTSNGNSYIYQGPIPAILRIPVLVIAGHSLDGRLTQVSMLVAFIMSLTFACRLHWKARTFLQGDVPLSGLEAGLVGLFTFALAGGSVFVFEASRAWVYHEALLWGCAFALASLDLMVSYIERPTRLALACSAAFAAAGLLTRASVGMGPVLGLALLATGALAVQARRRWPARLAFAAHLGWLAPGRDGEPTDRSTSFWLLASATVAPIAAYAVVNLAKFGTLFSVPFYGQEFSIVDAGRQAFLAENGGTLFGLKFMPTTMLQYLRPDALHFSSTFPFVDFASFPGTIIGGVRFDLFDRSSSVPSSLPFFFGLTVVGLWVLFRPAAWKPSSGVATLRVPMLAAGAAAGTILPFGYIAHRYLADFMPLLALGAAIGLQALLRRWSPENSRRRMLPLVAALVVSVVVMTWVNIGLALRYQREWSYNRDPAVIAGFLGFQHDVAQTLGFGDLSVEQRSTLPNGVGRPGRLVVIGDCEGLYLSDGMLVNAVKTTPWNGVERTAEAGHFRLRATFPDRPVGTRVPLFTTGTVERPNILFAEYAPNGEILFEYDSTDPPFSRRYVGFPVDPHHEYEIDIAADWRVGLLSVMLDDVAVLDSSYAYRGDDFRIGRNALVPTVDREFGGIIERIPTRAPLCNALRRGSDTGRS